jgi:hypothetical protein
MIANVRRRLISLDISESGTGCDPRRAPQKGPRGAAAARKKGDTVSQAGPNE